MPFIPMVNMGGSNTDDVGNIEYSLKNDLGNSYLLCDGRKINVNNYPKLNEYLKFELNDPLYEKTFSEYTITDICVVNGLYVACGFNTSSKYPYVFYSNTLNGEWTITQVNSEYTVFISDNSYGPKIRYYNNTYAIFYVRSSNYYNTISFTTDITGAWTTISDTTLNNSTGTYGTDLHYHNGTWYIPMYAGSTGYGFIYKSTDLTNWSYTGIGEYNNPTFLTSYNDTLIMFVKNGMYSHIWYSDDDGSTWTKVQITTTNYDYINGLCYYNGLFVCVGGNGYNSRNVAIWYSSSLDGPWTKQQNFSDYSSYYGYKMSIYNNMLCISATHYNNTNTRIYYTNNIENGEWNYIETDHITSTAHGLISNNKYLVLCGNAYICYSDGDIRMLPSIDTGTDVNAFIKVK